MAAPSPAPKNLVVKRVNDNGGNALKASWGNPADALTETDHKWHGIDETWWFNASKGMTRNVTQQRGSGHPTGDVIWVRDQGITESTTVYYDRSKYHPITADRRLTSVLADIYAFNPDSYLGDEGLGQGARLAHAKFTYTFKTPRAPEISEPVLTAATGTVKFTVTTNAGADDRERYDTMYCITRQDSANRNNSYKQEKTVVAWASTTDTSKDVTYDMSDAQNVSFGQWVKVTCKAYSRGLAGNSATVTRVYYYSYPAQPTITGIVASGLTSTDIVTVRLNANASTSFPVDSLKLQRLRNTTITNPTEAGLAPGWQDVQNAVDNGACTGLSDLVSNSLPDVAKHTWYRLVSTHGPLTRNSLPVEAVCLYRAKDAAASDTVQFVSVTPGDDGASVMVRIAWNNDNSNTTQLSWAKYEDAWESTDQPTVFDVGWEDATAATGYNHSATVTVRGLEEGTACYIRARRAKITESQTVYGAWCNPAAAYYPVFPAIVPTDVTLFCDAVVERGRGVDCRWTYSGSPQTAWQICNVSDDGTRKELMSGVGSAGAATVPASAFDDTAMYSYALTADETVVTGKAYYTRSSTYVPTQDTEVDPDKTYYSRSGAGTPESPYTYSEVVNPAAVDLPGYYEVTYEYLLVASPDVSAISTYYERSVVRSAVDGLRLTVSVTAGGKWTESGVVPVTIMDAPELSISCAATLVAQPLALSLECTSPTASVTVKATSRGVSTDSPTGSKVQAEGDVVWAEAVSPSWVADGSVWTATVTAPVLDLYDGATYDIEATAADGGLSSDTETASFAVAWSHQAVCPTSTSAIVADASLLTADITPVAPSGAAQTDVVDVYRLTPDGAYLIATDVPFGTTVRDRYAPFSNNAPLSYRLCTRTVDGDLDWGDRGYSLDHATLRFDWADESLELPYNIAVSDSWDKGFELREHLDGGVSGYWGGASKRTAALSTDVVKVEAHEKRKSLASLAKHAGVAFVRTPDGAAFPANVDIESYGVSYETQEVPISISATEVALTDEFSVAPNDWAPDTTTTTTTTGEG